MTSTKVVRKTLRQDVVKILRDKILIGEFSPGDRIVELEVANDLGISRGPLREALRQLEQEGLVVYHPHKGCTVKTLSAEDAWEIYTLKAYLESLAVHMVDGNVGDEFLKKIEDSVNRMALTKNQDQLSLMVELDHEFHSNICACAGKSRLYQLWNSLSSTSFAIFLTVHETKVTSLETLHTRHKELLDVLKLKDAEASSKAISEHYLSTGQKLFEYEKSLGTFKTDIGN